MSAAAPPIRVLVADDDAILREIAGAMLRAAGFTVQTVACGDEAVAACALSLPDIALLDVEMPDGNGYSGMRQHSLIAGRRGFAHRHGDRMRRYAFDRSSP